MDNGLNRVECIQDGLALVQVLTCFGDLAEVETRARDRRESVDVGILRSWLVYFRGKGSEKFEAFVLVCNKSIAVHTGKRHTLPPTSILCCGAQPDGDELQLVDLVGEAFDEVVVHRYPLRR